MRISCHAKKGCGEWGRASHAGRKAHAKALLFQG